MLQIRGKIMFISDFYDIIYTVKEKRKNQSLKKKKFRRSVPSGKGNLHSCCQELKFESEIHVGVSLISSELTRPQCKFRGRVWPRNLVG